LKSHTLAPSLIALVVALAAAAACGGTSSTGSVGSSSGATDDAGTDDGGAVCDPAPCAADGGTDPAFDGPSVCTSGAMWTRGDRGSASMHPGGACITCHDQRPAAPTFTIAGTVFPTAHEPDDCNGSNATAGAQIVITDANGKVSKIAVNSVGNFYLQTAIALPFHAKVVVGTKERAMVAAQKDGDCNSCHTEKGANAAPGRIVLP
jgi:hypothetical protein